jgi:tetratricopeptide (TPR) repeat protein
MLSFLEFIKKSKINFIMILVVVGFLQETFAQSLLPPASPAQTIQQKFADISVVLTYSRPSLRGRTIYEEKSELAPLGKLWRVGANYATVISFSDSVWINNQVIDSGKYAIFAIPGKTNWEIIFNKGVKNWGTFGYKKEEDILRFTVPVVKKKDKTETFTMQFDDVGNESIQLTCIWNYTKVSIPIERKIKNRVKAKLYTALQSGKTPFEETARFYYEFERNPDSSLHYVNKAIQKNPDEFSYYLLKAKVLKDLGKKSEAVESAETCMRLAKKIPEEHYIRAAEKIIQECKRN